MPEYVEVWDTVQDHRRCETCELMHGMVFPVGQGPMPPIHPFCRCIRRRLDISRLDPVRRARARKAAYGNAAQAAAIIAAAGALYAATQNPEHDRERDLHIPPQLPGVEYLEDALLSSIERIRKAIEERNRPPDQPRPRRRTTLYPRPP